MLERLSTRFQYEWDIEETDEYGDIVDHNFWDQCPGIPEEKNLTLVLVKNVLEGYADCFEQSCDLKHRAWAYVVDGKLPEEFDDGSRVPKRFHDELARRQQ